MKTATAIPCLARATYSSTIVIYAGVPLGPGSGSRAPPSVPSACRPPLALGSQLARPTLQARPADRPRNANAVLFARHTAGKPAAHCPLLKINLQRLAHHRCPASPTMPVDQTRGINGKHTRVMRYGECFSQRCRALLYTSEASQVAFNDRRQLQGRFGRQPLESTTVTVIVEVAVCPAGSAIV